MQGSTEFHKNDNLLQRFAPVALDKIQAEYQI